MLDNILQDARTVEMRKPSVLDEGGLARTLGTDGAWPDIDYANQAGGSWKPALHMNRVLDMALVYRLPGGRSQGDPALAKAIHSALGFWLARDFICPNWWHNEIGIPMTMARTMLLMDGELTPVEREGGLKILARAKVGMTGQNRVWLAGINVSRGLLENDSALVRAARDSIAGEIVVSTKEGVQPDFSFHQHGALLQFGNYGLGFAGDQVNWANVFEGTSYAFNEREIGLLRDYLLEGESQVLWGGVMDHNACGRQLYPRSPEGKGKFLLECLRRMQSADPGSVSCYQAVVENCADFAEKGNTLTGNRFFWRSDFMVDRRTRAYASLRMSSRRVLGAESVCDENLQGLHMGDGAFCLYQTGHEYDDIFAVWDWSRVPGVTCLQNEAPTTLRPIMKGLDCVKGVDSDFVGGVSNGTDGIATMDYRCNGVAAHKSAFFMDGQIVFLGAAISGSGVIATSVNQCLLEGPVTVGKGREGKASVLPEGFQDIPRLSWVHHGGVGYVFLDGGTRASVGGQAQKGSWHGVYAGGSPQEVVKNVFSLRIDHGDTPTDSSYSYVVLPGVTTKQTETYAKAPRMKILSNTKQLQAIQRGKTIFAVFYEAGECEVTAKKSLVVDRPCAMIFENIKGKPRISIASPAQQTGTVEVKFNGKIYPVALPENEGMSGASVQW